MAQQNAVHPSAANAASKKRKEAPTNQSNSKNDRNKRHKPDHRSKQRDARTLISQTSSTALKNGELNVEKFVKAREYEIRALEEGISRSKKALTKRAFQQVPKDLRRRTASHNAKKVPKRLQKRAKKEVGTWCDLSGWD
jgi:ribonuclease P/MRP protein subunit POP1